MLRSLSSINDQKKNNVLVNIIKGALTDLTNSFKTMSENEKRIEQPDRVVCVVEEILDFNKQNGQGQGLKILTPAQMLSRLHITLAQLKAGNNSEKLKNEIRQLFYLLCCSKKLTKTIYNNLVNTI